MGWDKRQTLRVPPPAVTPAPCATLVPMLLPTPCAPLSPVPADPVLAPHLSSPLCPYPPCPIPHACPPPIQSSVPPSPMPPSPMPPSPMLAPHPSSPLPSPPELCPPPTPQPTPCVLLCSFTVCGNHPQLQAPQQWAEGWFGRIWPMVRTLDRVPEPPAHHAPKEARGDVAGPWGPFTGPCAHLPPPQGWASLCGQQVVRQPRSHGLQGSRALMHTSPCSGAVRGGSTGLCRVGGWCWEGQPRAEPGLI